MATVMGIPKIEVFNDEAPVSGLCVRESVNLTVGSSPTNLASSADKLYLSDSDPRPDRRSCALSETDDEELVQFRGLNKSETTANSTSTGPTVIVDPPSPPRQHEVEEDDTSAEHDGRAVNEHFRRMSRSCRRRECCTQFVRKRLRNAAEV